MQPWDTLRDELPDWAITFTALEGVAGLCDIDARTIFIDWSLSDRERRSTIMHEALHAIRGDRGDDPAAEEIVEALAARLLISVEALQLSVDWATHPDDVASILTVDFGLLRTRLRNLDDDEASIVNRGLSRSLATLNGVTITPETAGMCAITRWWVWNDQPAPLPCGHRRCQTAHLTAHPLAELEAIA